MNKAKDRICFYDNVKFIMILLVVIGHFVDACCTKSDVFKSIYLFVYAFHMPVFLFVSGQFHKNDKIVERVMPLIFIGFFTKILISVLPLILYSQNPTFTLLADSGMPWYMFALAFFIIISYFLRNIDKRLILIATVLIALFVGYDSSIKDTLYLSRVIVFYPFYLMGQMISREDIIKVVQLKYVKIISVLILAVWAIVCFKGIDEVYFLRPLFTGRNPYDVNEIFSKWGFLYRAMCYMISIITGFAAMSLIPTKNIPYVTQAGRRTLQIYFLHYPVIAVLVRIFSKDVICMSPVYKMLWLLCAVCTTVILSFKPLGIPIVKISNACKNRSRDVNEKNIPPVQNNQRNTDDNSV